MWSASLMVDAPVSCSMHHLVFFFNFVLQLMLIFHIFPITGNKDLVRAMDGKNKPFTGIRHLTLLQKKTKEIKWWYKTRFYYLHLLLFPWDLSWIWNKYLHIGRWNKFNLHQTLLPVYDWGPCIFWLQWAAVIRDAGIY